MTVGAEKKYCAKGEAWVKKLEEATIALKAGWTQEKTLAPNNWTQKQVDKNSGNIMTVDQYITILGMNQETAQGVTVEYRCLPGADKVATLSLADQKTCLDLTDANNNNASLRAYSKSNHQLHVDKAVKAKTDELVAAGTIT